MTTTDPALANGIEEYLVSLRVEKGLAGNTIEAYRRDLGQYVAFLDGRAPTAELAEAFISALRGKSLASSTISRKIASLRGLHRFLVAEGLSDTDPMALVETPRRPDPFPKALSISEATALVEAPDTTTVAGTRDRALLEFLYATGARVTETVGVDLTDFDLDNRNVLVTGKGSKQRYVPLGGHSVTALRAWLPHRLELLDKRVGGDPVFLNLRGRRLSRQGVFDIVKKQAIRAGIDSAKVSPHVFRHSAATHMIEAGADLRTVQEMLGHATISTTQVYTRVSPAHVMEIYVEAHPRSR